MTIAFDAFGSSAVSAINFTWGHTPVGTPRGVVVLVVQDGGTLETVAITYASLPVYALPPLSGAANAEPGYIYPFFVGSGIPTGAVTCALTRTGSQNKRAVSYTVTGAADTYVEGINSLVNTSLDDPSFTIPTGVAVETMAFAAIFSGLGTESNVTAGAGWSKDTGSSTTGDSMSWEHLSAVDAGGGITCAFTTTAADDVTMYGIAIKEQAVPRYGFVNHVNPGIL